MEYRQLGNSGLKVSVLTMGTMTFGGKGNFAKVGNVSLDDVRRLIDIVADAGVNLIDTANVYSGGASEEMIGEAMPTRKPGMLIATKARFAMGDGPNDRGLSRWHLTRECEASLGRDQHAGFSGRHRLADQLFGSPAGIDIGGVDQVDPGVGDDVDQPAHLFQRHVTDFGEVAFAAERHRAHRQHRNHQA